MECSAESNEGLEADSLSWLEAGPTLGQRRPKARWTARSLVRGNRRYRGIIEGGSGRLG